MKKYIFATVLGISLTLGATVFASRIEAVVPIMKGWNLIYGFAEPTQLSGKIDSKSIKAIYVLIPNTKEYARLYPNPEIEKIRSAGIDDDEIMQHPAWVYSSETAGGIFNGVENGDEYMVVLPPALEHIRLFRGLNFVGVLPEMVGKTLDEIKGSCQIEKAYGWQPDKQNWGDVRLTTSFEKNQLMLGFVAKVTNDCSFSSVSNETIPAIPNIPN